MKSRISIHESLFLILGAFVGLALLVEGQYLAWTVFGITSVYAGLVRFTLTSDKVRLIAAYAVAWAFYAGSTPLVEALSVPLRHQELLAADSVLHMPWTGTLPAWANDILSAGYLSYHVYLHWACIDALFRDPTWRLAMSRRLFTAFGVGFVGYLTFPAAPPVQAFPELFTLALAGGPITAWNASLNAAMAARYDAFPSLHLLITLMLLSWDFRRFRFRFSIMVIPSILMAVATLALRLHYTADLIAALVLFACLHVFFERNQTA